MAYSSKINLRLSETPKTSNQEAFPDMVDVYNALHILAQYVSSVIDRANPDKDSKPWESMSFNNSFWLPAAVKIKTGNICSVIGSSAYLGCGPAKDTAEFFLQGEIQNLIPGENSPGWVITGGDNIRTSSGTYPVWGMALSDAEPGELVRLGVGPAIVNIEGVAAGSIIYAARCYDFSYYIFNLEESPIRLSNDGGLYSDIVEYGAPGGAPRWRRNYTQIGYAVATDAVYIQPSGGWSNSVVFRDVDWA